MGFRRYTSGNGSFALAALSRTFALHSEAGKKLVEGHGVARLILAGIVVVAHDHLAMHEERFVEFPHKGLLITHSLRFKSTLFGPVDPVRGRPISGCTPWR